MMTRRRVRAAHLGPERRRPQVLDAALELAASRGIQAVNMEAVAQAIGVTKPAVYACFRSRDDLLVALLEREDQRLYDGLAAALPAQLDLNDPERFVTEGFLALVRVIGQNQDAWRFVRACESDPGVADRHRRARRRLARQTAELVDGWLELRGVAPDEARRRQPVIVETFLSICDGVVRLVLTDANEWRTDELAAFIGRFVLAGIEQAMTPTSATSPDRASKRSGRRTNPGKKGHAATTR